MEFSLENAISINNEFIVFCNKETISFVIYPDVVS